MARQTTLFDATGEADDPAEQAEAATADSSEPQKRDDGHDICDLCGKAEPKDSGRVEWYNGGSVLDQNPTTHEQCYRLLLRDHGFMDNGYAIDGSEWHIFSATTGVQRIDPRDVTAIEPGRLLGSETVFPHRIRVHGERYGENTHVAIYGVTAELVEALIDHGYVERPDELDL